MAQPTAYNRLYNFVEYALAHTSETFQPSYLDAELDAVETTLDGVLANMALIQRDDGALKNASVHVDSFTTASLALIASEWTPRGLWVTSTAYVVGDVVQNSTSSYVCATAHTSGTFNTDYTAGKWVILGQTVGTVASGISCSAYGHIASTNVQGFLEELVDEKARLAGSTSQTFDVGDATDDTHAVAAGQVQKDSLRTAAGGGSSDAITATIASGLTALTDRMAVRVRATAANGTTAPTFNLTLGSTATGAKTIKKGAGSALVEGDIAGAGHNLELVYDATLDCWLLQNPSYPVSVTTAGVEPDTVENFGIAFSVGSNALTATVKTAAGGTPTAANPVKAALRSSSASTGTYNTRQITSTLSLTISSGSTLGHTSAVAGRLHWYLIDNSGTLELAVSQKFHGYSGIVSTTAEGGAGAADSPIVMYSTSARSNVPFVWVARTVDTQTTAGTWASNPTAVYLARDFDDLATSYGSLIARTSNTILGIENNGESIYATGTWTQTLDAAATLGDGWAVDFYNGGTGLITIDPNSTEQINGATTLVLYPGESTRIVCNGSAFRALFLSTGPVLMASATASSSASIEFTGLTGFARYEVAIHGVQPANDGATMLLRMSTNSGVSYDSGNNYSWAYQYFVDGTGAGTGSGSTTSSIAVSAGSDNAVDLVTVLIDLQGMAQSLKPVMYRYFGRINTGAQCVLYGGGLYSNASAADAIQLLMDTGNITGGTFKLYGYRG